MRGIIKFYLLGLIFLFLVDAYGCAQWTGGTMRIDVEVYKGPLSQEPEIQWGELVGYLEEAKRGMAEVTNFILAAVQTQNFESLRNEASKAHSTAVDIRKILSGNSDNTACSDRQVKYCAPPLHLNVPSSMGQLTREDFTAVSWCDTLRAHGWFDVGKYLNCVLLRGVYVDSFDLIREINDALTEYGKVLHDDAPNPQKAAAALREISELSSEFRGKAFRWAVGSTAGGSSDLAVRVAIVNFIVAASEYGNQLQTRADALMKQYVERGRDHRELPLSVYLRDTQPTDFVHLYDWLDASTGSLFSNNIAQRINSLDRLFINHHWTKINTAYASGAGQVRMAFVKDAVGNWDLKDFDNAPAELLQTYAAVAKELTNRALELAKQAAPQAAAATSAIQLLVNGAKQVLGTSTSVEKSKEATTIQSAGEMTAIRLKMLLVSRQHQDVVMRHAVNVANQKLEALDKDKRDGSPEQKNLSVARDQLKTYRKETLALVDGVLVDHGRFLDDFGNQMTLPKK
jgi:hypothetical protein